MVRKTKEEAQATRSSILSAASEVFLAEGVAQATLEGIAQKAGVTRGAIYWHFKNKMDIFEAMHEQLHQSVMEMILQDLEKDHPLPMQQLEELCVTLLLDLQRNPEKARILMIFLLKCDYSGEMAPFLDQQNRNKAKSRELLSRYFDRAKAKGYLQQGTDSAVLTMSLFCYLTGILHEYFRNPEMFDMQTQAPRLIRQLFTGLDPS